MIKNGTSAKTKKILLKISKLIEESLEGMTLGDRIDMNLSLIGSCTNDIIVIGEQIVRDLPLHEAGLTVAGYALDIGGAVNAGLACTEFPATCAVDINQPKTAAPVSTRKKKGSKASNETKHH